MRLFYLIIIEAIIIYSIINKLNEKDILFRSLNQEKLNNKTNIFIAAHKDFNNSLTNPIYKILADDPTQLKNNYSLHILYTNKGKLFKKRKSYAEMSKLYYVYELYKNGTLSSKYIGLNHYRRYFDFMDEIPDFDKIFESYDIILPYKSLFNVSLEFQYCSAHLCKVLHEVINIIKEIKPEYYQTAIESLDAKDGYFFNMFIMKKEDFFKYCEFIYDIFFEFDRRHNFTTDKDIINYLESFFSKEIIPIQIRIQGFLSERLSSIFFKHNFKKIKNFPLIFISNTSDINKERKKSYEKYIILVICTFLIINIKIIYIIKIWKIIKI
jgi:hypothetical protein